MLRDFFFNSIQLNIVSGGAPAEVEVVIMWWVMSVSYCDLVWYVNVLDENIISAHI